MARIHVRNHYFILLSSVLCGYTGLPFQNNYSCLYCATHCARPLWRVGFIQDGLTYWSFPFASHCFKLERNLHWRVNNCHTHSSLSWEGSLGASLCINDHTLYQATLVLCLQLTGSGMNTWPKGRHRIGWPGVHEALLNSYWLGCGQTN